MKYIFDVFNESVDEGDKEYNRRFNLDGTIKTGLSYHYIDSPEVSIPYFVYSATATKLIDNIRLNDGKLLTLIESLPKAALSEFLLSLIVSEITKSAECEETTVDKEALYNSANEVIYFNNYLNEKYDSIIKRYSSIVSMSEEPELSIPESSKEVRELYDDIVSQFISKRNAPDGKYFRTNDTYIKMKGWNKSVANIGTSGEENIINEVNHILKFSNDESIPLIIRTIIMMYHLMMIRPFYDGNQRLARFITSLKIRQGYSCGTSLSLARGTIRDLEDFYESSSITLSKINMGELNSFVDNQLSAIIIGQEVLIEFLKEKISRIKEKKESFEKEEKINTEFKKCVISSMIENYFFNEFGKGIRKDVLLKVIKMDCSNMDIEKELKELEDDKIIWEFKEGLYKFGQ